ncbi:LysR substrate-binding domain-containing protein [Ramlibacter aurantiacus]|uniref:LysR substrate-binding domain-containing protein n=1 Tax=Ramlibacter aurantiacus TaxID=2801330 RepID=UPI0033903C7C
MSSDDPRLSHASAAEREVPDSIERIKALRCLSAVAEHGSTTRAAEVVHLSQPAVTRSIRDLEHHVGEALFERGARGMAPTPLGARLATRSARMQALLAQGAAEALQLSTPPPRRAPLPQRFAASVAPAFLKALLAVAARSTESAAAEALGITQPAVHRSLQALQDACGASLYIKSARGTRLTDSGEALLRRVKLAVAELRAMEADIAAWRGQVRGRVVIGALPMSVHLVLPRAVAAVRERHPEIRVTVVDGTYESLTRQLRSADVDLVVGALRAEPPSEVEQEPLFQDELAVIARPDHPCLQGADLSLQSLLHWPWVVPLPNTPARAALERAFTAAGLAPPDDFVQATSSGFTRAIVSGTDYLAFASMGQARRDERAGILRVVPVPMSSTTRKIGIAMRSGGEPSPDLLALLESLRLQAGALGS